MILATVALLIMTPAGTAAFWLVAGALAALVTVQVTFWIKTNRQMASGSRKPRA